MEFNRELSTNNTKLSYNYNIYRNTHKSSNPASLTSIICTKITRNETDKTMSVTLSLETKDEVLRVKNTTKKYKVHLS